MLRTLTYTILLLATINSLSAQTTFGKEPATITFLDGRTEEVKMFDENQRYLSQRIIVINKQGQKKEYSPEELMSFSVGKNTGDEHIYISKFYNGQRRFYQKISSGKYPIYLYVDKETKRKYFFESELSNNQSGLIYLRDLRALQVIAEKFDIPVDTTKTLRKNKLIKVMGKLNEKANTPFQEYKKRANLRIGLSYSKANNYSFFTGSFFQLGASWQGRNDAKNFSYRAIIGLIGGGEITSYFFSSGVVWKPWRKRIQPYIYLGAGGAVLTAEGQKPRSGFILIPSLRPGLDVSITNDIALKAELVLFRPSFGLTYKIR